MIRELINFTSRIDEEFKNLGSKPKEGLHISIKSLVTEDGEAKIDSEHFQYEQYSKNQKDQTSSFLSHCKLLHQNAWCIDTNKCFDLPTKAIHTCSPFAVGFKREHLKGGAKFEENKSNKKAIYQRFGEYFSKAFTLFENEGESEKYLFFANFFTNNHFSQMLTRIDNEQTGSRNNLLEKYEQLKNEFQGTKDRIQKETLKDKITQAELALLKVKPLEDSSYIIFYLDVPLDLYKQVHKKYLDDKLFNTDKYNTPANNEGLIYGTSNFMNGFNSNMPFLMHQTASFDITGRISNVDAKLLNDLKNIFPNKILPCPLPIFIYEQEIIQDKVISIFKDSGFKFGYKEIIQKLVEDNKMDIANYYLLFWQNSKEGIVFKDFDYVSRFEYKLKQPLLIQNLFSIKEKGKNTDKHYSLMKTIFELEQQVFKPLIQNKYLRVDYFGELNKEDYAKLNRTFSSFSKYRKAVYDFIYKSQKNTIDDNVFYEMVFNSILDDVSNINEYGIKEKLNIWYSLFDNFNPKRKEDMVNKLKEYQDFVSAIIAEDSLTDITDEKFAFAAGQVIEYILSKSKSEDNSYNLLEPYLQQSKCSEFKKAIANDFGRYKHQNFSKNFEKVAAFILSYETDSNLKHLLPQILSGVFAKNQLFSSNSKN